MYDFQQITDRSGCHGSTYLTKHLYGFDIMSDIYTREDSECRFFSKTNQYGLTQSSQCKLWVCLIAV